MLWIWIAVAFAGSVEIGVERPGVVRVKAAEGTVHMPTCRGMNWEWFDQEQGQFVLVPGGPCGPMGPAVEISAEGRLFSVDVRLPPLPESGFHIVRPSVVVGHNCVGETPFPVARCEKIETVHGPQMTLRHRGRNAP